MSFGEVVKTLRLIFTFITHRFITIRKSNIHYSAADICKSSGIIRHLVTGSTCTPKSWSTQSIRIDVGHTFTIVTWRTFLTGCLIGETYKPSIRYRLLTSPVFLLFSNRRCDINRRNLMRFIETDS